MKKTKSRYWIESSHDFEDKAKEFAEHLIFAVEYGNDEGTETIATFNMGPGIKENLQTVIDHLNETIKTTKTNLCTFSELSETARQQGMLRLPLPLPVTILKMKHSKKKYTTKALKSNQYLKMDSDQRFGKVGKLWMVGFTNKKLDKSLYDLYPIKEMTVKLA